MVMYDKYNSIGLRKRPTFNEVLFANNNTKIKPPNRFYTELRNSLEMKKLLGLALLVAGSQAYANDCQITLDATDTMQFTAKELSVPASCGEVTLTLNHAGSLPANVMGHNWVLSKTSDVNAVAMAGASAGLANDYLPAGDAKVLAATTIIGGGASTTTTFSVAGLKGQDLTFFCSFPGHSALMKGKFSVI